MNNLAVRSIRGFLKIVKFGRRGIDDFFGIFAPAEKFKLLDYSTHVVIKYIVSLNQTICVAQFTV